MIALNNATCPDAQIEEHDGVERLRIRLTLDGIQILQSELGMLERAMLRNDGDDIYVEVNAAVRPV